MRPIFFISQLPFWHLSAVSAYVSMFLLKDTLSIEGEKLFKPCRSVRLFLRAITSEVCFSEPLQVRSVSQSHYK